MTNRRAIVAAIALLVVGVVVWKLIRLAPAPADASSASRAGSPPLPSASRAAPPSSAKPSSEPTEVAGVSPIADALNSPTTDIRADLRVVADLLEAFRTNFPQEGNPTGTNDEITAALTGRNPARFAFIPRKHRAINAAGELCDRWGTPFFFHAESRNRMEIRSAGPDRKMWTDDDVVYAP